MISKINRAFTIDKKLLEVIDHLIEQGRYKNRSDGLNRLALAGLGIIEVDNFIANIKEGMKL